MHYPKYLEIDTGDLLVFDPSNAHTLIARRCNQRVLSAGLLSASRHPRGRFFGDSMTLRANAELDWSQHTWFEGDLGRSPAFATTPELLAAIGATDVRQAAWVEVDGIRFPSSGKRDAGRMLSYFLP